MNINNNIYKITALIICVFLFAFLYILYNIFVPQTAIQEKKIFVIQPDQSGAEIFANLQKEGIIEDVFWAKVVNKVLNIKKFYRGQYAFEKPVSVYSAIRIITSRPVSLAVLIPEGFTKKQIADRLANYIINFDKKDFLEKAREGYLYPDTYYFFAYSTNEEILKEFDDKFNKTMLANFGRMPTKNEVIIASMLEREAKGLEDMSMVSGIIQNRLKINMALQIDATVQYGNGVWKERVLYRDLQKESDYNTYQNTGLPIGPISNPGLDAFRAAIKPKKNNYIYYLTGKDGKMYYATDHDQHVINKVKYLLK
jgi:UPF0755 protein